MEVMPEPIDISTEFGKYTMKFNITGDILHVKRKLIMYKGEYQGYAFESLSGYLNQVDEIESKKIILRSRT